MATSSSEFPASYSAGQFASESPSCDNGHSDYFNMGDRTKTEQLNVIHMHMELKKKNIEELMERFGTEQPPPPIFLEEYQDLTDQLSELQVEEQRINNEMSNGHTSPNLQTTPPPEPADLHVPYHNKQSLAPPHKREFTNQQHPKSPLSQSVRAFLPNQQRTSVLAKSGTTLKYCLSKAMKMRELTPEMCIVYRVNPRMALSWDTDMMYLAGEEISVELKAQNFPAPSSISHNFVRKTFFAIAFCDSCQKLLFHGFRCQTCSYKFHQRCANKVPTICISTTGDNLYKLLLALRKEDDYNDYPDTFPDEPESPSSDDQDFPRNTLPRERSTSAPNICQNAVNVPGQQFDSEAFSRFAFPVKSSLNPNGHTASAAVNIHGAHGGGHGKVLTPNSAVQDGVFDYDPTNIANGLASSLPNTRNLIHSPKRESGSHSSQPSPTHQPRWKDVLPGSDSKDNKIKPPTTLLGHRRTRRDSNDDWEIPTEEIRLGSRIGAGSFGTVFSGQWHGSVAVKRLNVKDPTPSQLQAFKNEVAVLRKTRHANILLFMGCTSKPQLAIVTQWCEGSSLYKHLHVLDTKLVMHQLIDISRQTAQGMDYLHAKNIIHRDLKSNNIFLHDDLTVKIGDFGLATVKSRWSGSQQFEQPSGSILWMAPEVIRMRDTNPYSFQSDVYAFGVVLFELVTQSLPYQNIKHKDQIIWMVGRGYLQPDLSKVRNDTPKALKRLITDCYALNRDERPLFPVVLAALESLARQLPKIHRSASEPSSLNRARLHSDDFMYCPSPKTPIQSQFAVFPFDMRG
ncbi:serine/threonine-protein kinase A-Raf isoform X1 [Strongylocentrotus purpuratus]|uniref:non-specific serine/threonine protein kinase n=1 Tax=Strongylocentrotus purpuratus TaxID=7668 RepID=A0A7M7LP57_STRPU|nr:serine/threonine-protein kinase A-Raf isoform X1 [Strongylocentrotus purpuratus]|eukprot:XP_003725081.2 PREDICTED: serine/threonine-protein kinase A-Raf isoform X1 [Strongylocentrotus purpuratus]